MRKVFRYSSIRADHLEYKNPDELGQKLPSSFAMYEGKNSLIIVSNDPRQSQSFSKFQNEAGVTTLFIDLIADVATLLKKFEADMALEVDELVAEKMQQQLDRPGQAP